MLLTIPDVLTRAEVLRCRELLEAASWRDGRATAGHVALRAKANQQLAHDDPLAQQLATFVLERLGTVPRFISAALPLRVLPPQFNRYADSGTYGNHIDNAIFTPPGGNLRIRSDLSATLFFSDPEHYKGGELVIDGEFGESRVKLPAGHMVLYSASTLHRVTPVTRGVRLAAFFWVQSMVREDHRRRILLELDDTIQAIGGERPDDPAVVRLTGIYHNLLRDWAAT